MSLSLLKNLRLLFPLFMLVAFSWLAISGADSNNRDPKKETSHAASSPSHEASFPKGQQLQTSSTQEYDEAKLALNFIKFQEHLAIKALRGDQKHVQIPPPKSLTSEAGLFVWNEIDTQLLEEVPAENQLLLANYLQVITTNENGEFAHFCWAPGSDPATVLAFHEAEQLLLGEEIVAFSNQFLGIGKWTSVASSPANFATQGAPVPITWSIVPEGTLVPDRDFNNQSSDFRAFMVDIYGGSTTGPAEDQPWFPIIEQAFNDMAEDNGITLIYEPADDGAAMGGGNPGVIGVRGDVRVGGTTLDGNFGTLAFAFSPNTGDMVFDTADSFFNTINNNSRRFRNVASHELGHALGLAHVCPINNSKLMEPTASTVFDGPQFTERFALNRQYGDFYEISGNDTSPNAVPLSLTTSSNLDLELTSIDGENDTDFFSFSASTFERITINLSPVGETFLEGPQNSDGSCSDGEDFFPQAQQDLSFSIIAPDGSEIMNMDENAIGNDETLTLFDLPQTGTYFLEIRGNGNDNVQIYSLEASLIEPEERVRIQLLSNTITAESGVVKNNIIDPEETIEMTLEVINNGDFDAQNATLIVTVPDTVWLPTSTFLIGDLAVGASTTVPIQFAFLGECNEQFEISLSTSDDISGLRTLADLPLSAGLVEIGADVLVEEFQLNSLPTDWTTATTGIGVDWTTTTNEGRVVAFSPGINSNGTATLTSEEATLGQENNTLSFVHSYIIQRNFDGALLEYSRNGGPWLDLPTDPAVTVVSNGYNGRIISNNNEITQRDAWMESSGGYITSEFLLPEAWAEDNLRLRWILAHNNSGAQEGWYIDSVSLNGDTLGLCEPHRPALSLTAQSTTLTEGEDATTLTISPELPLASDLSISLEISGQAESADLNALEFNPVLPAGQQSLTLLIGAVNDGITENRETFSLSLASDDPNFASTTNPILYEIIEPLNYTLWASQFFPTTPAPSGDEDNDGRSNLLEYLLDSNPSQPDPIIIFSTSITASDVNIAAPPFTERNDLTVTVQNSSDIEDWQDVESVRTPEGFTIPLDEDRTFTRLSITLETE